MALSKLLLIAGLSAFLISCSTMRYGQPSTGNTTGDVGMQYLLGRGVPKDDNKAFYYFHKAAKEGDAFAQNEVAYMYAAGKGTKRNYANAFVYYQKAAKQGLASAQYNLGLLYFYGIGTEKNSTQGLVWFNQSAQHGFEPARRMVQKLNAQST